MATPETGRKSKDFRLCPKCNKIFSNLSQCPRCSISLHLVNYTFFLKKNFGKYYLNEFLGMGGMGIVYLATHKTLNKKVAIKVFIPNCNDTSYEKRFLREARILAELKHPNIIEIYDFDISQWDTPYYVMEYLVGKTLREEIEKYPKGMPMQLILEYLGQIIECIEYAHKQKIIHRDLKPENIFIQIIQGKRILKILDFGIAKSLLAGKETAALTRTQTVLGSPYYLSPEQIVNKNIGPHTDQYALALIIYEMLTGKIARKGKSIGEIIYEEAHQPVHPKDLDFTKIPNSLGQILIKATMPKPEDRFPTMTIFGKAIFDSFPSKNQIREPNVNITLKKKPLKKVYEEKNIKKKPIMPIEDAVKRETHRKRLIKILIGVLVLIICSLLIFYLFKS